MIFSLRPDGLASSSRSATMYILSIVLGLALGWSTITSLSDSLSEPPLRVAERAWASAARVLMAWLNLALLAMTMARVVQRLASRPKVAATALRARLD